MPTRRRFLAIVAGAAAAAAAGTGRAAVRQWRGVALGAGASLHFTHPEADRLIALSLAEIDRMEQIFSLHRPDSALARLNRDGRLEAPPLELLSLLSLSGAIHSATGGAFDPTIQPLWALYAERHARGLTPSRTEISETLARTGWTNLRVSPAEISFGRPGMAMTLNGIAQGYIADRIADLLRAEGLADVLVNTGEIAAVGHDPDGAPWRVNLAGGGHRDLTDAAIATTAPLGTVFDRDGKVGHILDPRTGKPGGHWRQVSVIARSAARADGLSTAFALMRRDEIAAAAPDVEVILGT